MANILAELRKIFSANRLVAIAGFLSGLAPVVAGLAQVLPSAWANYALVASGLILKAVVVVKFLAGSQKWDAMIMSGLQERDRVTVVRRSEP